MIYLWFFKFNRLGGNQIPTKGCSYGTLGITSSSNRFCGRTAPIHGMTGNTNTFYIYGGAIGNKMLFRFLKYQNLRDFLQAIFGNWSSCQYIIHH